MDADGYVDHYITTFIEFKLLSPYSVYFEKRENIDSNDVTRCPCNFG